MEEKEVDQSSQEHPSEKPVEKQKGFFEELLSEGVNLDRGLLATILTMFTRPQVVIDSYFVDKKRYTNPFRYAIVVLAFTTLITTFFIDYEEFMLAAMEVGMESQGRDREQLTAMYQQIFPDFDFDAYFENLLKLSVDTVSKYNSIMYILLYAPFFSIFSFLFFRKNKSRFVEHFVMNLYAMTQVAIVSMFITPIIVYTKGEAIILTISSVVILSGSLGFVYAKYLSFKGFFDYMKFLISFGLGYAFFSITYAILLYIGAYIMTVA